jgi:3-hydroxyisobutyrate dehydrogenase
MEKMSVALLGLGTMGRGMAANLLKADFPLTVWNRSRERAEAFVSQGARVANTPAEAASGADIIIAMVADDNASRETWAGTEGALSTAKPGAVLVEASTASPAWIAELATLAEKHNLELLDAPVTGSRAQAEGGQLTFLVGGSESALERARPVLEAMSQKIAHLGPVTSGAKMKLLNNFLCGVQLASLAEGMAWLERSDLNRDQAIELLKSGAPGSPLLGNMAYRMTKDLETVNFSLALLAKDLAYAHTAAAESGVDLTTAANAKDLLDKAIAAGYGEKDMANIVEVLRHSQHNASSSEQR